MKLILVLMLLFLPTLAIADDEAVTKLFEHSYSTDQTWSGTVMVGGVVQFAPETTLTILPGTTVIFAKTDTDGDGIGENEVYVQGRIIANGTPDKPITFTSGEDVKRPGDWGALNIMVSEGKKNELSNCIIEYGYRGFHMHFSKATLTGCKLRNNYLGIQCQDSELSVTGCEITGNRGAIVFKDSKLVINDNVISDNYWGIRFLYGEAELTGNTISGNMVNGVTFRENKVKVVSNVLTGNRKGFSAEESEVDMLDNVVRDSVESGLYLKHSTGTVSGNEFSGNGNSGISIEDSDVSITGNDITGNGYYAIDNNGATDVDAVGNWWGTTDAARISGMIYDKADDAKIGEVVFEPVAAGPVR